MVNGDFERRVIIFSCVDSLKLYDRPASGNPYHSAPVKPTTMDATIFRTVPGAREISQEDFWEARGDCKGGIHVARRFLFSLAKSKYPDCVQVDPQGRVSIRYKKMVSVNRKFADAVNSKVVPGDVWRLFFALDDRRTHVCCGPCTVVRDAGDHWILVPNAFL